MERDLEDLRRTLLAQGIVDASVSSTVGRSQGSIAFSPTGQPRASTLPEADLGDHPDDEFVIHRELGRGGMATVWLAQQSALAREVAIKRVSLPDDPEAELLLLREAVITGQLEHPNIVPVHQLVVDEDGPAVVMKRLVGDSWDELIHDQKVSLERHLEITLQVLNALAFAHSRGVFHRDVKPANVMIGDFGQVYLLDWGVACRKTDPASDAIVGTPRYMAPEMADGKADERTDVFLLGATLHEAVTGVPRHQGHDAITVLYAAMYVEPYAYGPEVPEELANILNRACARDPKDRFADMLSLRAALETFREHRIANTLTQAALERLKELESALPEQGTSYDEIQRLFSVARFAFDAALRVWPESSEARSGLTRCVDVMIDYEISHNHPDIAAALLKSRPTPDPVRAEKVERVRRELEREQERLRAIERDRDPNVGAKSRTKAYMAMGAAALLMTVLLAAERLLLAGAPPNTLRLVFVGAAVLTVMIVIVLWWRQKDSFNFINRRIAEITVAALAVSFANRLSGHIMGDDPAHVLVSDALILGFGGAVLSAYHSAGPWLAALSFSVAMLGSIWPAYVDEMFIGLTVFVPSALWLFKRVRADRLDPQHPSSVDSSR